MLWSMGSQRVGHDWVTELKTDGVEPSHKVSWTQLGYRYLLGKAGNTGSQKKILIFCLINSSFNRE